MFLDFQAQSHQRFGHFIKRFLAPPLGNDISLLLEFAQLFGDVPVGNERVFGDFLDGHGAACVAQRLHDPRLLRRECPDALLEIGGQILRKPLESRDQCVQRISGQELREHDVHAVIAARKVMQRPYAVAAFGRAQELHEVALVVFGGDFRHQLSGVVDGERLQMHDFEEPIECGVATRYVLEQLLRRCQRGHPPILLKERPPFLLAEIAQTAKRAVEVFHDQENRFVAQAADDFVQDQLRRIVRGERPRLSAVVGTEFVRILLGQFVGDS